MKVGNRRGTVQDGRLECNESPSLRVSCPETKHLSSVTPVAGRVIARRRTRQVSDSNVPSASTNIILQTASERLLQA